MTFLLFWIRYCQLFDIFHSADIFEVSYWLFVWACGIDYLKLIMQMFNNKSLIKRISDACYSLRSTESTQLPALKKQLKQNKKEIDNLMKAIKAGLFTKSTKAELERLEQEQETLEVQIAQEQIKCPVLSREQIELWITHFAKSELSSPEQKQRLIDIFVNGVYVYDDKIVVIFNYKNGKRCISFEDMKNALKSTRY